MSSVVSDAKNSESLSPTAGKKEFSIVSEEKIGCWRRMNPNAAKIKSKNNFTVNNLLLWVKWVGSKQYFAVRCP